MRDPNPGLHAAFQGPLDLAGRETLLAAGHEVDDLQPDMKRHMAGLENGSHPDGERFPAGVALPKPWPITLTIQPAVLNANESRS